MLVALVLALVIAACGEGGSEDPFDEAAIRRDLDDRSIEAVYDEYEKSSWTPPASGRVDEQQVMAYVRTSQLALRILQVCCKHLDQKLANASHSRNAATAEIRAAQRLGLNPRELDWVGAELRRGAYRLAQRRKYEKSIAEAKRTGTDDDVDEAIQRLAAWKQDSRAAERANCELFERHEQELRPFVAPLESR